MGIPIRTKAPAVELATDQQGADNRREAAPRVPKASPRNARAPAAAAFLQHALNGGALQVAELEVKARAAGLLGDRQTITNSKPFKAAKVALQIQSRRTGFGRGAVWFWALPAHSGSPMSETVAGPSVVVPVPVIYDGHGSADISEPTECAPSRRIPQEWIRGVACLRQQSRPSGVPEHRWRLFVADCVRFIDPRYPWAERAAELRWETKALFGFRYERPLDHLGCAGLLWDLTGGAIVQFYNDNATIAAEGGKQRIHHRRPISMMTALPWA
jgi:hypothetical protein